MAGGGPDAPEVPEVLRGPVRLYGGVELGGTKVVCVVGTGPDRIVDAQRAPTTSPEQTLGWAVAQLGAFERLHGPLAAIGIASFGPVDLRKGPGGAGAGRLLNTPKPGWAGTDVAEPFRRAFGLPLAVASDVEGAAMGEGISGAARDVDAFVYVTVGTGVGAGAMVDGAPVRGILHPEIGHIPVPRHPEDTYEGSCPFHGDCLEGLACGPAMAERWGRPAEKLEGELRDRAMDLEAFYVATGLRVLTYAYAPERIVIGGGVGLATGLLPRLRTHLVSALLDYPGLPEHARGDYVVPAGLGELAGAAGALALAERAS